MKQIIHFHISKGDKYYTAQGVDLPVITQGKTLDELASNIQEAVALHLEDENLEDLGLVPEPSLLVDFELTTRANA